MGKTMWRTEQVNVEKFSDGGRALTRLGGTPAYQTLSNSEYRAMERGSETVGDKLHCREGNNPDQQLRCLNNAQWKGCGITQTVRMLA